MAVTTDIEALLESTAARACFLMADQWSKSPGTAKERFFAGVLSPDGLERLEVSILLVDDADIRKLNRTHRGKDHATDVLSFPMLDPEPELEPGVIDAGVDADPVSDAALPGPLMLGDIVISMPTAARQAEEYGHTLQRELGFLTVHGVLHLLGCDHEEEVERVRMRELEELVLSDLRLTR